MYKVSLTAFQSQIADMANQVHFGKITLIVTKHGKPWMMVAPYVEDGTPAPEVIAATEVTKADLLNAHPA